MTEMEKLIERINVLQEELDLTELASEKWSRLYDEISRLEDELFEIEEGMESEEYFQNDDASRAKSKKKPDLDNYDGIWV